MVLLGMDILNVHGRGPRHSANHRICTFTNNHLLFHTIDGFRSNKLHAFPPFYIKATIATQTVQIKASHNFSSQTQIQSKKETTLCQTTTNNHPKSTYLDPPAYLEG